MLRLPRRPRRGVGRDQPGLVDAIGGLLRVVAAFDQARRGGVHTGQENGAWRVSRIAR
ncbi:MAG: hypothetical protein ACYC5S_08295 [Thiobacillus sp.]